MKTLRTSLTLFTGPEFPKEAVTPLFDIQAESYSEIGKKLIWNYFSLAAQDSRLTASEVGTALNLIKKEIDSWDFKGIEFILNKNK